MGCLEGSRFENAPNIIIVDGADPSFDINNMRITFSISRGMVSSLMMENQLVLRWDITRMDLNA